MVLKDVPRDFNQKWFQLAIVPLSKHLPGHTHTLHIADHPRSSMVYNFEDVCMSVIRWLLKTLTRKVHFRTPSVPTGNTGQVRIWRSSGQGQGHRNKKVENPYSCNVKLWLAITTSGGGCELASTVRCRTAWGKFRELLQILTNKHLPLPSRGRVYSTCVRSVMLHLSLIHIWRCRRSTLCRSRWSPYH